jgi:site-specific recombinase XerD
LKLEKRFVKTLDEPVLRAILVFKPNDVDRHRQGRQAAVVPLSKILGHSEVSTTMKYLHLVIADLQAPHQRLSILNRLR